MSKIKYVLKKIGIFLTCLPWNLLMVVLSKLHCTPIVYPLRRLVLFSDFLDVQGGFRKISNMIQKTAWKK